MNLKHRQTCRICGNPHLTDVIDLGDQYLQGSFVKDGMTPPTTRKIPTKLVRCDVSKQEGACGLVQTSVSVPPQVLYSNYWYQSAISKTMRDHLKEIVEEGKDYMPCVTRVLDIASNDGTLLNFYSDSGSIRRVGIDPSDIARKTGVKYPAYKPGKEIEIINDVFPSSQLNPTPHGKDCFGIITSIAMFYDVEDPVAFVRAIKNQLSPNGVWIVEVAYLPATLRQVSYDTIVHEHLLYYSLATLEEVFRRGGMRCIKATLNDTNGGSIRCVVVHNDDFSHDKQKDLDALNRIRVQEFDLELDTDKPYDLFKSKVTLQKHDLLRLIEEIKNRGETIHLYGASTKANTLIQYCGLDHNTIPYAWERSPEKVGGKTLGTGIKMISEEDGRRMSPNYVLVGPWHFKDEILKREADTINKTGVKFIFPLPKVEVVDHV
jgi:SAM-dependent methyltransferase